MLRVIAGLEVQDAGRIEIAGRDVTRLPSRGDFGIVFQSYALFPNLTVAQNIGYGRQPPQVAEQIAGRVAELLALVGLPEQGEIPRTVGRPQQRIVRPRLASRLAAAAG